MKLDLIDIESSAHQNFLDYIRNDKTQKKYGSDLKRFVDLIPSKIYQENNTEFKDKTEAFVTLTNLDVKISKSIINTIFEKRLPNFTVVIES